LRNHLPTILVLLILAAAGFASPAAFAQPLRIVAVIDAVKFPPKAKQAHERLREALQEALAPKSWFLAEQRRIADCGGTLECMGKVARETGTSYVVRLSGTRTRDDGYDLTVELYTAQSTSIESGSAVCDHCDLQRINEAAGKTVLDLLAGALKAEAARKEAKKAPPALPPPAPPPPPPTPELVTPPPAPAPTSVRWLPWTLIGVGAIAAGYGTWALVKNGSATGSCTEQPSGLHCAHYSSGILGAGLLVGGGALVVAGAFWLLMTPSHSAAVTASPNHVALHVRF
jgi:hypothetical protein